MLVGHSSPFKHSSPPAVTYLFEGLCPSSLGLYFDMKQLSGKDLIAGNSFVLCAFKKILFTYLKDE